MSFVCFYVSALVSGNSFSFASSQYNTPVQLGPQRPAAAQSSRTSSLPTLNDNHPMHPTLSASSSAVHSLPVYPIPSSCAHIFTIPVQAGDILILASDGLSDNLWDEDVVEEVVNVKGALGFPSGNSSSIPGLAPGFSSERCANNDGNEKARDDKDGPTTAVLRRRTLASTLSEALCSRARRVVERKAPRRNGCVAASSLPSSPTAPIAIPKTLGGEAQEDLSDETPFARRAREQGKAFSGGKNDGASYFMYFSSLLNYFDRYIGRCSCHLPCALRHASSAFLFSFFRLEANPQKHV